MRALLRVAKTLARGRRREIIYKLPNLRRTWGEGAASPAALLETLKVMSGDPLVADGFRIKKEKESKPTKTLSGVTVCM